MTASASFSWNPPPNRDLIAAVDATLTASGLSYIIVTVGPAGGPGMGGHQSLEEFLEHGALYDMPSDVAAQARDIAEQLLRDARARVTWTIVASGAIDYVSADINGQTVKIAQPHDGPAQLTLFEGTLSPGPTAFVVFATWRSSTDGAKRQGTSRHDLELAAGGNVVICTQLDATTAVAEPPAKL